MRKIGPFVALVLLAVLIGALLWLVLGGESGPPSEAGPNAAEVHADAPADEPEAGPGRRRARRQGTSVVLGEVRLSRGDAPAVGQRVSLSRPDAEPWVVETDAAGAFRIPQLPHGGPYELRVAAEGFATVRLPGIALDRGEERDVGTLWLDLAVRAEIHVKSLDGKPLPGAEVQAFAAPDMRDFDWSRNLAQLGVEPVAVASATTDAAGVAVFPELAAGSWTFTAVKEGYAMRGRPALQLRAGDEREPLTIYLGRGYTLTGRVTNQDGEGIGHALLLAAPPNIAWSPQVAPLRQRALADEAGRYELPALSAGDVVIYAGRPDAPPGAVATVRVPSVTTFDIVLRLGGTLEGTVTLASSGAPVAGAIVRASSFGGGGNSVAEALTDEAGKYVISTLSEGTVNRLTVEKEGYVEVQDAGGFRGFPLRRDDTLVRDLQLGAGVALSGTVRGPSGALAGARVTVYHGGQRMQRRSTTTDGEGRYAFAALRPGAAVVQVEQSGYYQVDFPSNWWQLMRGGENRNRTVLEDGAAGELDIEMAGGSVLEGRVETLGGEPIAGARLTASVVGQSRNRTRASASSQADGSFRIEGIEPAPRVVVVAAKRGLGAIAGDPVEVVAGEPTTGVVVRMAPLPTIRGRITTQGGEPPAEAYVKLQHQAERGSLVNLDASLFWTRAQRHAVQPDGTYEIVLPAVQGSVTVHASAPGWPDVQSPRTALTPERAEYEVDLVLPAGDGLRGVVLAKVGGEPIAGAWVRVNQQRSVPRDGMLTSVSTGPTVVAVTDADGRFALEALQRAKHRVRASADGYVDATEDVELPAAGELRLLLPAEKSISGVVVLDSGDPVVGATVFARAAAAEGNPRRSWTTTTGGNGAFVVPGLAPGTYRLTVSPGWRGGVNILETTSEPLEAGATDVRLVTRAGLTISGTVIDGERKPVEGARVNAAPKVRTAGVRNRFATTSRDGSFEIVGLRDGAYTLSVNPAGPGGSGPYQPARIEDVAAGSTALEVVLQTGLAIEGVLLDAEGKPMANTWISARGAGDGSGQVPRRSATTDSRGHFEISGLQPGRYRLESRTFGPSGMTPLILEGGADVTAGSSSLRLTARQGLTLTGVVVDGSGQPVRGARVLATAEGDGGTRTGRTSADGAFEIRGLRDGAPVSVIARANGFIESAPARHLPGDAGLRIELDRGLSADGVVLGADGEPVANGRLTFVHSGSGTRVNARTDSEGRFRVQGLSEGTYDVVLMVPDPAGARRLVPKPVGGVRAGETGVTLQVR